MIDAWYLSVERATSYYNKSRWLEKQNYTIATAASIADLLLFGDQHWSNHLRWDANTRYV